MVDIITFIVGWVIPIVAGGAAIIIAVKLIWGSEDSTRDAKRQLGRWLAGCIAIVVGIPLGANFFSPLANGIKAFLTKILPGVPNLDLIAKTTSSLICIGILVSMALAAIQLVWGSEDSTRASKHRATAVLIGTIALFVLFAFGDDLFAKLKNPIPEAVKKIPL